MAGLPQIPAILHAPARHGSIGRRGGFASACLILCLLALPVGIGAQSGTFAHRLSMDIQGGALLPLTDYSTSYDIGFSSRLKLDYALFPFLQPQLLFEYSSFSLKSDTPFSVIQGGLGFNFDLRIGERVDLGLGASGGMGLGLFTDSEKNSFQARLISYGMDISAGVRLSPSTDLVLSGGLRSYAPFAVSPAFSIGDNLVSMADVGLVLKLRFGTSDRTTKVSADPKDKAKPALFSIKSLDIKPIFPVFHSYYDSNAFGEVEIRNGEDSAIRDVKVYFESGDYMSQPKLCATIPVLAAGQAAKVPLYALFSEDVLNITENSSIQAKVRVDYRLIGAARAAELPLKLTLFHRNAMNWTDDRRAAAFASPTDPAVLWFSKYVSGLVTDRERAGINRNMQLAMGIFEAERLFGINYVVDPSSSYVDNVSDETSVDYLQYPHQTLAFRGGDCDDLSILFVSLLESIGIKGAFITIPGHIYAAVCLELTEAEAKQQFYDPQLLIYQDGIAWLPVEITMVKDGFVKAWRVGAKEWYDNAKTDSSKMFPIRAAWKLYPAAGLANIASRFALPDEASLMQAFDSALDRYVVREIDAEVRSIALDPTKPQSPENENALGLVYGQNGMLKEAWAHFSAAAKGGYTKAWTNLANVAFLRRDYELAVKYFDYAQSLDPSDDAALLGRARSYYELERFSLSDADYAVLQKRNPILAAKFGYLASIVGGQGRAWSLADRLSSTNWTAPELAPALAPSETAVALADASNAAQAAAPAAAQTAAPPAAPPAAAAPPPVIAELVDDKDIIQAVIAAQKAADAIIPAATIADNSTDKPLIPFLPQGPVVIPPPAPAVEAIAVAPVQASPVPEAAKPAPVAATPPLAVATPAPVAVAPAPEAATPASMAAAPAPEAATPASMAAAPTSLAAAPASLAAAPAPVVATQAPVAAAPAPIAETPPPAVETAAPVTQPAAPSAVTPVEAAITPEPVALPPLALTPLPETVALAEHPQSAAPLAMPSPTEPAAIGPGSPSALVTPASPQVLQSVRTVAQGLAPFKPVLGTWTGDDVKVVQLSDQEYFAKIIFPLASGGSAMRYSFNAKSIGHAWVGYGIHVAAKGALTHKGYGEGHSWLVWITSDPVHLGSKTAHIQLYRSDYDTELFLVSDAPIPEDAFFAHSMEVDVDPASGSIVARIDGTERLRATGLPGLAGGEYVVLRALDKTEFDSFTAEELK